MILLVGMRYVKPLGEKQMGDAIIQPNIYVFANFFHNLSKTRFTAIDVFIQHLSKF